MTATAPHDGIVRNSVYALGVQLVTAAFTAAVTLVLVRSLDPGDFGVLALALSVGALLLVPSDFGLSHSTARFAADRRDDPAAVAAIVADALKLKVAVSAVVALALAASAGLIADAYDEPSLAWPLRAIALAVLLQSVFLFFATVFVSQSRNALNLRLALWESVVELSATLGLVLLGTGATGAAFGRVTGYAVGAALSLVAAYRLWGKGLIASRLDRVRARAVARYAGALAVVDSTFTVFSQMNALLIGALLGGAAVGLYSAPLRLLPFLGYAGLALANAIAPRLAGAQPNVRAFTAGVRVLVLVQAALLAPLVVWAQPIVDVLFGERYADSASTLRAFAPFVFLTGVAPLVSLAVNYVGGARRRIPIALAAVAVDLAIVLLFVPDHGIAAAAVAASAAYALYVPAHIWICHRTFGLPLGPIVLTAVRSIAAAAAAGGALALVGTDDLSATDWIVGAAFSAAAFAAVLFVLRETSATEIAGGVRALRHRAGGARA